MRDTSPLPARQVLGQGILSLQRQSRFDQNLYVFGVKEVL